jgi:MarR family transcriptional regulator, transcriptional regulator for hemolysin
VTARATRALLDRHLADEGASFATWQTLNALHERGDLIQRDLARALEVEGPTLVRQLDQLEGSGLIQRSAVPGDRRRTMVSLAPTGRKLHGRLQSKFERAETELMFGFDTESLETLRTLLQQLLARARHLRAELSTPAPRARNIRRAEWCPEE